MLFSEQATRATSRGWQSGPTGTPTPVTVEWFEGSASSALATFRSSWNIGNSSPTSSTTTTNHWPSNVWPPGSGRRKSVHPSSILNTTDLYPSSNDLLRDGISTLSQLIPWSYTMANRLLLVIIVSYLRIYIASFDGTG